jgi:putative NADH-flavin reductase
MHFLESSNFNDKKMKLCIFGADGRSGIEVVRYANQKGYETTAFVFNDLSKNFFPPNTKVFKGNVMEYDDVFKALDGADSVISVLGHIKGSDIRMQTKGIENISRAMNARGIKRILSLTGTGAREIGDTPSLLDVILNFAVKIVDKERIADGVEHVKTLKKSDLDWTVIRVLKLGSSQKDISKYRLTDGGPAEILTSRKKVAHALVDLIDNRDYFRKLPVVSS